MQRVLAVVLLVALVGCAGEDDPAPDPTLSTSGPSTSTPPSDPSESPGDVAPVEAYTAQIVRSDASRDATALARCVARDPAATRCNAQLNGLILSAQALAVQFMEVGTPTEEVADLVADTIAAARAVYDEATAYQETCPDAGATSEQCAADLVVLSEGTFAELVTTVEGWDPYL